MSFIGFVLDKLFVKLEFLIVNSEILSAFYDNIYEADEVEFEMSNRPEDTTDESLTQEAVKTKTPPELITVTLLKNKSTPSK